MRILHVIADTDSRSGGTVAAVRTLSQMLSTMGHSVVIASLEPAGVAAQRGFEVPVIGMGSGIDRHRINPRLGYWLDRQVHNFDVVILHGLWDWAAIGSWPTLKKHRIRYFIFAHGMMAPWFREHYPLKHMVKQIYWWLALGRVLRDAEAVFFTNEEERIEAKGVFHGPAYKERVLKWGTAAPKSDPMRDREEFYLAYPELERKPFLLFIGRIHEKKGCDLLIEAFAECIREVPADLALVMAGPDQVGWAAELKVLARKLGVADRIHWPGMLAGNLKWGALRQADAMILPSHQENFGFVVPEAMAVGTPVLISNKVNIWRQVQAAGAGLVEPDTLDGTASLIRRFYRLSPQERDRMADAALQDFRENFDIEVTAFDFARAIGALQDEQKPQTVPSF